MLAALGTVLVGSASAANPTCGQTVTASVTLTADVGPCNTTDGLVVDGGHNIVINLNGHKVFSNAPLPRNLGSTPVNINGVIRNLYIPADFVGIHILDSTGIVVQGGTVTNFSAGVAIEGGGGNTVRNVNASSNQGPCIGEDFTTQAIGTYGDGIAIFSSANNKIQSNVTNNNGPFDGIGVVANVVFAVQPDPSQPLPTGNQITNNSSQNNNTCFADIGIRIEGPGASNNTVSGNHVKGSFNEGIFVAAVNTIDFSGAFVPPGTPATCQFRGFPFTHTVNTTLGSNIVTATQGTFSPSDVGKTLTSFTFPGPFPDFTPITGFISPTQVTIATNATGNFTGASVSILPRCPILNPLNPNNNNNRILNNYATGNGFGGLEQPPGPGLPAPISLQRAFGIGLREFCGYGVENGMNTLIQGNYSQGNSGDGIHVGGCAPNPATGQFDPGRFPGWTNNKILSNVALDNNARPGGARFDLFDGNLVPVPCDNNTWFANRYRTFSPPCTTAGGSPAAGAAAAQSKVAAVGKVAGDSGVPYPMRKPHLRP
ncbi:MAG: right-handed parallel beta-helix repeat-containing protein [Actinobacteria bacterium]|nr:right-handed parallel beta-helix repeat-containing protein [Actinomycetota bacterium]